MPVILKCQYLDLRWDWTCVSLSRMVCLQHDNALQHFALMLQRRGHPFWHESQGNWAAMSRERDTCNTITRLLIQSGETFVSTNSEIRNIFREYWCTAAPTPTRAGCKSVKNSAKYSKRLIASDGLRRYAFNVPNIHHAMTVFLRWLEIYRTDFVTLCHTGIPTDRLCLCEVFFL